jgi:hypothetical protein
MTHEEYRSKYQFLKEALRVALEHGDYNLEHNTVELLRELDEKFDREDTTSDEQEN